MNLLKWSLAAAAVLVTAVIGVVVLISGGNDSASATQETSAKTVKVERGTLSAFVTLDGTLTYQAGIDGSPNPAINQASGIYTTLPASGDEVGCGSVFYSVDETPVLLLCGKVPAYRDLAQGDAGQDVRQLNGNLHRLGFDKDAGVEIDPHGSTFTSETAAALDELQGKRGLEQTGSLQMDEAIFLPGPARIAKVSAQIGGTARRGTQIAQATSNTLIAQVNLDASQQGQVQKGDLAQITLPGNRSTKGRVTRLGNVAKSPANDGSVSDATIPAYISIDDPGKADGLESAPVQVNISTRGVKDALSVPVASLVGKSGGGYAVEVVGAEDQHELVAVSLGLFDTAAGRVQVKGDLDEGDRVAVPSL